MNEIQYFLMRFWFSWFANFTVFFLSLNEWQAYKSIRDALSVGLLGLNSEVESVESRAQSVACISGSK